MVIVSVNVYPKAAFKRQFVEAFLKVSKEVHQEVGCIEYDIYERPSNPSELFIYERWESQAAVDAHLKTPHMVDFLAHTESWHEKEIDIVFYEVK